jgi:hypothetical protein
MNDTSRRAQPIAGGLCETCNRRASCMHLRSAERAIVHCDEFDDGGPASKQRLTWIEQPAVAAADGGVGPELVGLCRDCAVRAGCIHLRRAGVGVWRCEDYQ